MFIIKYSASVKQDILQTEKKKFGPHQILCSILIFLFLILKNVNMRLVNKLENKCKKNVCNYGKQCSL